MLTTVLSALALCSSIGDEKIVISMREIAIPPSMGSAKGAFIWEFEGDPNNATIPLLSLYEKPPAGFSMDGYKLPTAKRRSFPFAIFLNGNKECFAAVLGNEKDKTGVFDLLWIDQNSDKVFSKDERVIAQDAKSHLPSGYSAEEYRYFGPIPLAPGTSRPKAICLMLGPKPMGIAAPDATLSVQSAYMLSGEVASEKFRCNVAVFDFNLDGLYDLKPEGDFLIFETGHDGERSWNRPPQCQGDPKKVSDAAQKSYVQFGDRGLYEFELTPDGTALTLKRDLASFGAIAGLAQASRVRLEWDHRLGLDINLGAEMLSLPQGEFFIMDAALTIADERGRLYTYSVFSIGESKTWERIEAAKTTQVKSGLPLKLSIVTEVDEDHFDIRAELKDSLGRLVSEVRDPEGKQVDKAGITIHDDSGKVTFKGVQEEYQIEWKPPKGAKGRFTVTANLDMGPLGKLSASKDVRM